MAEGDIRRGTVGAEQPTGDARDPDAIRREIEETREGLGDTVEALAAKTDFKARARAKADALKRTVADRKARLAGKAKEASPDSAGAAAGQAARKARENPMPVAVAGAFALGVLAGRMMGR